MNLFETCFLIVAFIRNAATEDPTFTVEAVSSDSGIPASADPSLSSALTVVRQGPPVPVLLVGGDAPLEPLLLPPLVDAFPEIPDRVGDTPLRVQTVVEAEPAGEEQPLDVPWVWDDKVCSPLLIR